MGGAGWSGGGGYLLRGMSWRQKAAFSRTIEMMSLLRVQLHDDTWMYVLGVIGGSVYEFCVGVCNSPVQNPPGSTVHR